MLTADRPETRLATRLAFLVAGFGVACWAPLVPFAKQKLQVDDGALGLLLLCLGVGSIAAMLLAGIINARYGSRPIILAGGFGLAVLLPLLAVAGSPVSLGLTLLAFGAALGSLDVAMNIHAVEVERAAAKPLMSGFHALFSVGGFIGATLITFLLSTNIAPIASTLLASVLMAIAMGFAAPRLLRASHSKTGAPLIVAPHGSVLLLAALALVMFLVEAAILDWSALLVTGKGLVSDARGGLGYSIFAIAMTAGRFGGDFVSTRVGDRAILFWGGLATIGGFALVLLAPIAFLAMSGFLLIGLGASNIVPVLFRGAGAQRAMPAGLAVAAITTAGYAGNLVGPAAIGFVAKAAGLPVAFWLLAALVGAVVLSARAATAPRA
ncbi:MAG TPA: MFS transporter [Roseiarcus sp.]|nr:MFS transporter [Roseiarcus sp.]